MNKIKESLFKRVSIAPLVVFRIVFGSLLLYSTIRTISKGWVDELYIDPSFYFSFFSWLKPLEGNGMYVVFGLLVVSSLGIVIGFLYRLNAILFFLLFAYCELLDKTFYLNHYYLVSLLSFLLIVVPAHGRFSVDALLFSGVKRDNCAQWQVLIFKIQLSVVYFFAGLAKVNEDWLIHAQPLATWLPSRYGLPIIGQWMHLKEVAMLFSWMGCLYDLFIWVFLLVKRTRLLAYVAVVVFHVLTGILFPSIGMFPYIMMVSTIVFFSSEWHSKVLRILSFNQISDSNVLRSFDRAKVNYGAFTFFLAYLFVQLYLPLRHFNYEGNLFWHEQGYRFSWRVMLMEKNGYTAMVVKDPVKQVQKEVHFDQYLTPFQIQQMKTQPDMLQQFANYIGDQFLDDKGYEPEIFVVSRLSLNGRRSQPFTNDTMNIYNQQDLIEKGWIVPFVE